MKSWKVEEYGQYKLNKRKTLKRTFFVEVLLLTPIFASSLSVGEYLFPIFIHSPRILANTRMECLINKTGEAANNCRTWRIECARITRRSDGIGSVDERFSSCFGREFVVHSCAAPLLNRIESKSIWIVANVSLKPSLRISVDALLSAGEVQYSSRSISQ